jgi:hypothetical protein
MAIHWWWMNKNTYWETFLKLYPTNEFWNMVTMPDYDKARKGIYEEISPPERRRRERIKMIKNEFIRKISNNKQLTKKLVLEVDNQNDLESIIEKYAEKNLDAYIFQSRRHQIDSLMEQIRSDDPSHKLAKQKAAGNDISVDSMIIILAIDQYKTQVLKY